MYYELFEDIDQDEDTIFVANNLTSDIFQQEHTHNKGQLLYAEGGVIHVFTESRHWYLPQRFFMWIPPNTLHNILSNSTHFQLFNIYYPKSFHDDSFFDKPNIYIVNDAIREMILVTKGWTGAYHPKADYAKFTFLNAIKAILPEFNKASDTFPAQHPYPKDKRLIEIASFLKDNLETSYTIDQIAHRFGFSTRTLSRLFKENVGFSYVRFLRSIRMSKALELMSEHQHNLYEIATLVGYNSLSSFSNIFYKIVGIRPQQYLQKINSYK